MKLIVLLCLQVALLVGISCSHSLDNTTVGCSGLAAKYPEVIGCEESTLQGLEFCSFMNGLKTDEGFNSQTTFTNGQSYASYIDNLLSESYDQLKQRFTDIQTKRGGVVCQACLDKIKVMMCANAFPAPGLRSCLVNNVLGELMDIDEKCGTKICGCPEEGLCAIRKNGELCKVNVPTNIKSIFCLLKKVPTIPENVEKCNAYFTPKDMCIDTMSTCGCVDKVEVASMCGIFFSKDGLRKIELPQGECANSESKWCGVGSTQTVQVSDSMLSGARHVYSKLIHNILSSSPTFSGISKAIEVSGTGTVVQQLVCPNDQLCIGNMAPLLTPTLKGAIQLSTGKLSSNSVSQSLVCEGSSDPNCAKGCTNPNALTFDPSAKLKDSSCNSDPVVWITWGKKSLPWIIAVAVIVVALILCLILSLCLCAICCCCRCYRRKTQYNSVFVAKVV